MSVFVMLDLVLVACQKVLLHFLDLPINFVMCMTSLSGENHGFLHVKLGYPRATGFSSKQRIICMILGMILGILTSRTLPPKKMDVPPDDHGRLGNHAIFCSLSTLGLKYPAAQPKIWASLKLVPPS